MTLYALIHAPMYFVRRPPSRPLPIEGRPYDTIYTERYMRTPQKNPDGFAATNLIAKVELLEASPLLIHGLGDTNVHLQNTVDIDPGLGKGR